jgi:heterodisulfide reductase subunit A
MRKIGVFICHCGRNIGGTVDVERVVREISECQGVEHCEDYKYMCSDPGQSLIKKRITEKGLEGIVVAACSPSLHEATFRKATEAAGLNPYLAEIANIREQCSWVHTDREEATAKAVSIIKTILEKVKLNEMLSPARIPVTPRALIIGGGIAGIQAALDIANSGYEVILVERSPSIGGHMAQLSETFPTLDCSQCILTPKMVEVAQNPNIELLTYSEVEEIEGGVGNFKVRVRRKASCVDASKCNGCGLCIEKCPVKVPSEFDEGLGERKAIYTPFPQAVPNRPVIDREHCLYFTKDGKCGACKVNCTLEAIDYDQEDEIAEEEVGAIIVATGYDLYPKENIEEYGGGGIPDVINGLQFERLLSASGPTGGEVRRPSDGQVPKRVAFISCAGSRDPEHYMPYCSKVCCMYLAKHAMLYRERVPDGEAVIFTIDVRTSGKSYEEFYARAKQEEKVLYIRGKPSRILAGRTGSGGADEQAGSGGGTGGVTVWCINTLTGRQMRLECDMAVLATPIAPPPTAGELAGRLRLQTNEHGFFSEAHPKLRPVESLAPGFFMAGCAQGPKDIPETVSQASAAASKVLEMFSRKELLVEPMIAWVDEDLCSGCQFCISACPYDAREFDPDKNVVRVKEALCKGCGACVAACGTGATQQKNLSDEQITRMVEVLFD